VARALIGTSGWSYKHWETVFYPREVPAPEHLAFFARHFCTVEINYSYYQLPPRKTFELWRRKSPREFLFAVKASRYLTHMKKLKDPEEPLERLMRHASGLGKKLGPVLCQFPRQWKLNLSRLDAFLIALEPYRGQRFTFEFRHSSWLTDEVYARLRHHNAALCLPIGWGIPLDIQTTADWTYLRFHGGAHSISFGDDELRPWARRIREWLDAGFDCYAYFNNDTLENGRAPAIDNAQRLRELIE
jgi:uncharacterized protein YecE (DUF72 family)